MFPMVYCRQGLAGESGIGDGFKPTDAGNRVPALSFRIGPSLPRRGSGLAGLVTKLAHRLFPGELASLLDEVKPLPVLGLVVSALVHKGLEPLVRDLVSVNQVGRDFDLCTLSGQSRRGSPS